MDIVPVRRCIERWTFACAIALLLAACGGDEESSSNGPDTGGGDNDLSVNAGSDRTVNTGTDVTLSATASLDDVTYQWTLISQPTGAAVAIASADTRSMQFTPSADGSYLFSVTVKDEDSNSARDEITVVSINDDLSVSAGSDRAVTTGTLVSLSATASLDDVTYQWTVIAQPSGAPVNIAAANTPRMQFTPSVDGSYLFRVTVNDRLSNRAHDEITVVSIASTDLETYDAVAGHTSDRWTVTASQGVPESSPVLYNDNSAFANNSSENHWTQFSFTGAPVEVVVTDLVEDVTTCVVRPLHDAVSTAVNTTVDSCTFTITEPGQWFVDTGEYEEPLFIFASEIDTTVPIVNGTTIVNFDPDDHIGVPWPGGITAVVFEPGVYNLDPNYVTPTDDQWDLPFGVEVYIKGGAWVSGAINVSGGSGAFKLRGRGTLSGAIYESEAEDASLRLLEVASSASGTVEVEGVTFSDPPSHAFVSNDSGLVQRDTKFFGSHHTTDGTRLNSNSILENSFFKTNDDAVKLYGSNITVRNLVMWAQATGCQIQLSWNQSANHANNLVEDIDVIHNDGTDGNYAQMINRGVVCSRQLNGGDLHDQVFNNFRIEVAMFQLFSFAQQWDIAGFDVGTGSLDGMTFSNWDVAAVSLEPEWFNGNGTSPGTITDFVFDKITINGTPLDDSNFLCEGRAYCASFTITP